MSTNIAELKAGNRVDFLIPIGASGLCLSRICLMLILTTIFLFELLLHQELLLDA
jgi:hypothetical protein